MSLALLIPSRWQTAATFTGLAFLVGCANTSAPQGYGVNQESTVAEAQRQMRQAEQSTKVDTAQTYLGLIAQMQQAGKWYASLAHTEAFEQQYSGTSTSVYLQVKLLRADALRNTNQDQLARQAYGELLTAHDNSTVARARRGLGLLDASQGQYTQAVTQLEMARKLDPTDSSVLSDLAYAHMLTGQLDLAQLPALQAAQLAPTNARAQLNLTLYWLASGNKAEANRLLEELTLPRANNEPPLIDQKSLQTLEAQLTRVRQAIQAHATNSPISHRAVPQETLALSQEQSPNINTSSVLAQPAISEAVSEKVLATEQPESVKSARGEELTQVPAQASLRMETQIISVTPNLMVRRQMYLPAIPGNTTAAAPSVTK